MKKIALVNLSAHEDISKWDSYQKDIFFLTKNNLPFVDYASGFSTKEELFNGFTSALNDPSVAVVWFVCGGSKCIECLDDFNWSTIKESGKIFLGLSDFTHFSVIASTNNIECYYGLALKKITTYYSESDQVDIVSFLTNLLLSQALKTPKVFSLEGHSIIGGHLPSLNFVIDHFSVDIREKHLFIEHHYIPGENIDDLIYYINQLRLVLKENEPKSIILGHSILFDDQGGLIDYKSINSKIKEVLSNKIDIPVSEIDHFKYIIKFN